MVRCSKYSNTPILKYSNNWIQGGVNNLPNGGAGAPGMPVVYLGFVFLVLITGFGIITTHRPRGE